MDQPGQNFRLDTMVKSLINCPSFVPRDERTLELIFQTADSRSSNAIHFILNPHLHVDLMTVERLPTLYDSIE